MKVYEDDTDDGGSNGSNEELQCIWNAYCRQLNAQVRSDKLYRVSNVRRVRTYLKERRRVVRATSRLFCGPQMIV